MIDAAGRGAAPIQLAASEMGRGLAAARAERPLAVALEVIGMHLARGERLTTPEVRQLVALLDATLDVFSAAAPAAAPTQVVLKTAQMAVRDSQRDATAMLTQHRELTTTLVPILDRLIVVVTANRAEEAPMLDRPPVIDHVDSPFNDVPPTTHNAATPTPPPPLAKLLASLIEAIAHLQPLLTPEPTPVRTLSDAITQLQQLPPSAENAAPVAEAIVQLQELVVLLTTSPAEAPPAEVANAIAQVIDQLAELVPSTASGQPGASGTPAASAPIDGSPPSVTNPPAGPMPPSGPNVPSATTPPLPTNPLSLTNSPSAPLIPPTETSASAPIGSSASPAPPTGNSASAPNSPLVPNPPLAPTPPGLQTAVAQIIANLQAVIVSTSRTETTETALRNPALNLALPFTGLLAAPPPARLENLDAYRWAMLAALSAWQAPRRPLSGRAGPSARRCGICGRLLEPTRIEALLCPTCQLYQQS